MGAFTGSSNPYWIAINNTGSGSGAGMQSENITASPNTNYTFTVTAAYQSTYASGAQAVITFYDVTGTSLSSTTATQANMTGGQTYQFSPGTITSPSTTAYMICQVLQVGLPGATNALQVFEAEVQDPNNNQLNFNYAFTYTYWPWSVVGNATLDWNYSPTLSGDADSLVLDGVIELMGGPGGVQSDIPELLDSNGQGPTFRILAPPSLNSAALGYQQSYDLNSPQPTQDVVASMLLDGERPFGTRSSNRTMSLPIIIFGTQAGGMNQVLKAREYLAALIDQQTWAMKWTSADTGLPLIFDCFRALPSIPIYGFNHSAGGTATGTIGRPNFPAALMTLSIQAMPYGRSDLDGVQNLSFTNPLVGGPQPNTTQLVDGYNPVGTMREIGSGALGSGNTVLPIPLTASVAAGEGIVVVFATGNATAQTLSVADSKGNAYASQALVQGGVNINTIGVLTSVNVTKPLTGNAAGTADSITVTTTHAETMTATAYAIAGAYFVDTVNTNAGAVGTSGTVSSTAPSLNNNITLAMFVNSSGLTASTPTGWTAAGGLNNSGIRIDTFWINNTAQNAETANTTFGGSTSYNAVAIALDIRPGYDWRQDNTHYLSGTSSAHFLPPRPVTKPYTAATYFKQLTAPISVVGLPVLSMWFGQAYDTQWPKDPKFISNVRLAYTLTDIQGKTLNFSTTYKKCLYGTHPTVPKWTRINAFIPQGSTTFNYSQVASYSVKVTNYSSSGSTGFIRMHCWLNALYANPQTISNPVSPRGSVYNLFSLPGTARSPISVQCQLPAAANITKEIVGPSIGNWIVPPGVFQVQAECWGAGGGGSAVNLSRAIAGGGGGGGEYAQEPALNVTPGQAVPWNVGAPGTPGQLASTVIQYTNTGLSHWTCPANVTAVTAECWGGGAAGGAGSGGGGGAEYAKAVVSVTPGTTYNLLVGASGKADTGTSARQVAARQGGLSWFGEPGTTNGNLAFAQAKGGSTSLTGASSGGYGGNSGTVAPATQTTVMASGTPAATTSIKFNPNRGTKTLAVGNTGIIAITVPAPATLSVSDSAKNTWTQIGSKAAPSGSITYVFWCLTANQLNGTSTVTINQSVSQAAAFLMLNVPWVSSQDVAIATANGTSTAPSVTSNTPNNTNDLVLAIFGNNGASTTSTPAGWTATAHVGSGAVWVDAYLIQNSGNSAETATSSYASSEPWSGIALTFNVETHYPGGRGGSSPASSGGGGGGAAGATGAGGVGGNSQPLANSNGRWAGGTGGAGTGLGGNGGAGAGTPGFPGAGVAPGGGGGGGFQAFLLYNATNPSLSLPGGQSGNYLGGDGGDGMVQLTYTVGSGSPVNGGNTTFGSTGTTTTVVGAHGGTSAANNSASGGAGGTGSTNTIVNPGGAGGLTYSSTLGSYMTAPADTNVFQSLGTQSYTAASHTGSAAASSCAQGVAVAFINSTNPVTDLTVTDSAGNVYQLSSMQSAQGTTGATVYAYVADIEYPITTSTTLSLSSATSQAYGVIWYASPWLVGGVTSGNTGTGHGTGTSFSGQFGVTDTTSIEIEVGFLVADSSRTFSSLTQAITWFQASSTYQLTTGTMQTSVFTMENQGGGTNAANTGDIFSGTLSGSANWAVLCVPFTMINQLDAVVQMDWRGGTTPGASTSWATEAAISAGGTIVVFGQSGTGVTAAPTSMSDSGGNVYTLSNSTAISGNGNSAAWCFTAPVTAALAAGATGTIHWGAASAVPEYEFGTYWIPNATGLLDSGGVTSGTGTGSSISKSYVPNSPNELFLAFTAIANAGSPPINVGPPLSAGWNGIDFRIQSYLNHYVYAVKGIDKATQTFTATLSGSLPYAELILPVQMELAGTGGGSAGGPANAGYPGTWQYGGPGYAGAGKGGIGTTTVNTQGQGGVLPGAGGGGAYGNTTVATEGGRGGAGALRLTWTPPLQVMNNLIVHSLGQGSDPNVNPIVPIPITDTPNNVEYSIPSVSGLIPASFNSTYTVLLIAYSWNSTTSSTPRQITVTINQYEYPGGPRYSAQCSRAVVPATDASNGILSMGEVTLPVKDYLSYNDQSYFTISINDTDQSDRFMDVLFLDTTGQTVIINVDASQPGYNHYVNYFIDEATTDRDLGFVGASMQDRQHQVSVLDYTQMTGPLYIAAGDNLFLTYSTAGAPDLSVVYSPRWFLDRMS